MRLSTPSIPPGYCGGPPAEAPPEAVMPSTAAWSSGLSDLMGFFTNDGRYMPRVHCMTTESGAPDWPWIVGLIAVTLGVIALYVRIYRFWRACYVAERPEDRNPRMMELANIFFWCAICGYAMSITMFFWPAYRLLAVFLFVLNIWSWRFVLRINDFRSALQAKRFERELRESLESRNDDLERQVQTRTADLEAAREEALVASEAKSTFLANMSHEIRTPLNAILGFCEVMGDPDIDEKQRDEYRATVQRNGEHLLALISDVLDISKIESSAIEIEMLEVELPTLLNDVHALMIERAESKGITLGLEIRGEIPAALRTDPTRLKQILINLTGNAIKFTDEGGVKIVASSEGEVVRINVVDTGIGMTKEQASLVFEPFKQADSSTTRRFGGTGLGLSISAHLAGLLGGALSADGEPGVGSTFTLELTGAASGTETVSSVNAAKSGTEAAAALPEVSGRVLCAEDGADNRRLVEHMLRQTGIELEFAEDGKEAVEAVRAAIDSGNPYACVLMDMQMPVMSGIEATRALRDAGITVPIIALTANVTAVDRKRCFDAGSTDFLSKPVRRKQLIETIASAIVPPARGRAA